MVLKTENGNTINPLTQNECRAIAWLLPDETTKGGKMAGFSHWISLIVRRFGKNNLSSNNDTPIETVVIPTVTMIADWAKTKRDDICQVWVFGSAIVHDEWDSVNDDLDILLIVSDDKWKHSTTHDLPREVPLSEQYLKLDIRVCKESTYQACEDAIKGLPMTSEEAEIYRPGIIEYAIKNGVCVWKRDEDSKPTDTN